MGLCHRRQGRLRLRATRRRRSPRKSRWSPTSTACAAPASPTRPRSNRRTPPGRKSKGGTRRDRLHWPSVPYRFSSGRRLWLEVRMHHGAVTREQRRLDQFVVPVDGELLLFFVDQGFDEGQQVLRIERRGGRRQSSRDIEMTDNLDAADLRYLARFGAFDISATLDSKVDDYRTRTHRGDHLFRNETRRRAARDQCGGDDDVLLLDVIG